MHKFHEKKTQYATSFTNEKNQHATSSTNKISTQKLVEHSQFHEDKNQFTSFTKRKMNTKQVSRTNISVQKFYEQKISTQQVP